jgi:hypothetical protein
MYFANNNYPRFGEQMDHLVRVLVAVKGWSFCKAVTHIAETIGYSPDSIYRWRRGERYPRQEEILEQLAEIGKDAGLDRVWGESFLNAGRHPCATRAAGTIWGGELKADWLFSAVREGNAAGLFETLLNLAGQRPDRFVFPQTPGN